ncbi:cytochrome C oxidase copper chaperone-domain-containing protein, partial [Lasiosphaeria miniovina]
TEIASLTASSRAPAQTSPSVDAAAASKPKPCCVCKDEKAKRDECMLFSNASDAQKDCQSTVDLYRTCMAGFGFKV